MTEEDYVKGLGRVEEWLTRCFGCGACNSRGPPLPKGDSEMRGYPVPGAWNCPSLDRGNFMSASPKGILYLSRALNDGKIDLNDKLVEIAYGCTSGGTCSSICPTPIDEVSRALREEVVERGYLPDELKGMVDGIKEQHNCFGSSVSRAKWSEDLDISEEGETLAFIGCYGSYRYPDRAKNLIKLLQLGNVDVGYLGDDQRCCGLPAVWAGATDIGIEMAEHNVEQIESEGYNRVVFMCPECLRAFRENYPDFVGSFDFETVSAINLIKDLLEEGKLEFEKDIEETITYHDPCLIGKNQLGKGENIYEEPREILKAIPKIEFKEMKHNRYFSTCCGSGASVTEKVFPETVDSMSNNIIEEAEDVAEKIVTACHRSHEKISQKANDRVETEHIVDIVSRAAKVEKVE